MSQKVDDIMTKKLRTIPGNLPIGKAHKEMKDANTRHLIIVNEKGELAGILSDRDVWKYTSPFAGSKDATDRENATALIKVGKLFTGKEIITVTPEDTIKTCVEKMLQKRFSALPVIDDANKPIGIVTTTDILKFVLNLV